MPKAPIEPIKIYPVKTKLVRAGDDYTDAVLDGIRKAKLTLDDGDVVVVSSKIVSIGENMIVDMRSIKPSKKALKMAKEGNVDPRVTELVLSISNRILGAYNYFWMAITKGGILQGNGGIDRSNVPQGGANFAILYPKDPDRSARRLREKVLKETGKRIGVILNDSDMKPLRRGVASIAIGIAGFEPVYGMSGAKDLFGEALDATLDPDDKVNWWMNMKAISIADCLSSAVLPFMGEGNQQTPVAVIKDSGIEMTDRKVSIKETQTDPSHCPVISTFREK